MSDQRMLFARCYGKVRHWPCVDTAVAGSKGRPDPTWEKSNRTPVHQPTKTQSSKRGKTAKPRYSQVRYAPASLGKMKRLATNQTQTANPNITRTRSPGVSYREERRSI